MLIIGVMGISTKKVWAKVAEFIKAECSLVGIVVDS
jgi:hypothetical protein